MHERLIAAHRRAREIFRDADRDGNGWLSKKELKRVLHISDDLRFELRTAGGRQWKDFWQELDANDDGKIEEQELIAYLTKVQVERVNKNSESFIERARSIFELADKDKNGWLSKKELKRALQEDDDLRDELRAAHGREWKDFWKDLDANDDGKIELQELVEYVQRTHAERVERSVAIANETNTVESVQEKAEAESKPAAEASEQQTAEETTTTTTAVTEDSLVALIATETIEERMCRLRDRVREIFERADKDKNGWLSKKELKNVLHQDDDLRFELRTAGGREWKDFWAELDANDDGKIQEEELVEYLFKVQVEKVEGHSKVIQERARDIFERADKDKNGWLSKSELKRLLHEDDDIRDELRTAHGREWKDFWQELDINGDGKIELEELTAYIEKTSNARVDQALSAVRA
eukprot:m.52385 g.52385  ORF g.52385 m.52385 type:complete len:411 (+) comp12697_c0_seq1:112-1344(+)